MEIVQTLIKGLTELIDKKSFDENCVLINDKIFEWENDIARFRYDHEKQVIYVRPKTSIEYLDLKVTILPNGCTFDDI